MQGGTSGDSEPVTITTAQKSKKQKTPPSLQLLTMFIGIYIESSLYILWQNYANLFTFYAGATVAPHNVMATVMSSTVIYVQWDGLDPCRHVNGLIVLYRVQ